MFGDSAILITAKKKCQTLDEYSEKTVSGAMGCGVLETNYILEYGDTYFFVENFIVSEKEMVDYAHVTADVEVKPN